MVATKQTAGKANNNSKTINDYSFETLATNKDLNRERR